MSTLRWGTSVHEAGHITLALLAHILVRGATVNADHSGLTEIFAAPWPSCIVDFGGLAAERLVFPADEIDPSRSRVDMAHAKESATRFCKWSESRRVVRRLGPPPKPGSTEPGLPALTSAARADVAALVSEIEKAHQPRREARVLRLLAHAERVARERLGANLITLRTIAKPLADYGTLDQQQLLELFAEGRLRQIEDDELWRKKA